MNTESKGSFSSRLGFIMAAAGSAVGLGNIWRFPYLAAKNGGGVFLFVYIILALTFGFTLLITEISIGRKTRNSALTAYAVVNKKFGWLGIFSFVVPMLILPYYGAIGGWVLKYLYTYIVNSSAAAGEGFFTGFITSELSPVIWMSVFMLATFIIVFAGVENGIEKFSTAIMPALIVIVMLIGAFSLTLSCEVSSASFDQASVEVRTGLEGAKIFFIPDFTGMTLKGFLSVVTDACGQLFYSISVAMGIMVAYGAYVSRDTDLMRSVRMIEIFDTAVAILAGVMIIPAVYVFMGMDGMSAGPGLMFVSLPKVFSAMGVMGVIIGIAFFILVSFAALTSAISLMEALVSSCMDYLKLSRKKSSVLVLIYTFVVGLIVCLGYNKLYFELQLPNGSIGQVLDVMDYVSNSVLMPIVAIATCILIGWVVGPDYIIEEVELSGSFKIKKLYTVMIKWICPVILTILLIQAFV